MSIPSVELASVTGSVYLGPMKLNSSEGAKIANLIAEYLPLPEHRLFEKCFFPNHPEYFTSERMETLIDNLAFLIEGPGSENAAMCWVDVFKGKSSFSQGREIACVLNQRWMIAHLVPVKSTIEEDRLVTHWIEVPFFTWKNLKALAANLKPPTPLAYHRQNGICKFWAGFQDRCLSDEQAELDIQKRCCKKDITRSLIA